MIDWMERTALCCCDYGFGSCGCESACCADTEQAVHVIDGGANTPVQPRYAYLYNTAEQSVDADAPVTFAYDGPASAGIAHTSGGSDIVLQNAGIYEVLFSVNASMGSQFALYLNGAPVSGGVYGKVGSGAGQQNNGFALLKAAAGDTLTLVNTTGEMVSLPASTGGTQSNVNASVLARQIA